MEQIILLISFYLISAVAGAACTKGDPPAFDLDTYYGQIGHITGEALKAKLRTIIKGHKRSKHKPKNMKPN